MEELPKRFTKDDVVRAFVDEYCGGDDSRKSLEVVQDAANIVKRARRGILYEQTNRHEPALYEGEAARKLLENALEFVERRDAWNSQKPRKRETFITSGMIIGASRRLFDE